jgi:hypothetical protein
MNGSALWLWWIDPVAPFWFQSRSAGATTPSPTTAPTGGELSRNPIVLATLQMAYDKSNAGDRRKAHEEGGWFFLNLKTGALLPRWAPPGKPTASRGLFEIDLNEPPTLPGWVVVASFHSHPITAADFRQKKARPGPTIPEDYTEARKQGVPGFVVDAAGVHVYGPERRRRLDDGLGFPRWRRRN